MAESSCYVATGSLGQGDWQYIVVAISCQMVRISRLINWIIYSILPAGQCRCSVTDQHQ